MANPNIAALTTILGNSAHQSLASTSATSLINNAAASNKVYKVESITLTNITTLAVTATVNVYSAASRGGTAVPLINLVPIPANSTLIIVDKTTTFYLLENQSVGVTASSANTVAMHASWEEIS